MERLTFHTVVMKEYVATSVLFCGAVDDCRSRYSACRNAPRRGQCGSTALGQPEGG